MCKYESMVSELIVTEYIAPDLRLLQAQVSVKPRNASQHSG